LHHLDERTRHSSSALRLALAVVTALALGCAAGGIGSRPDWVRGRSSEFPEQLYVTGLGVGSDPEAARESARAEIARVFRAQVESSVSSQTTGTTREVDGRTRSQVIETLEIATRRRRCAGSCSRSFGPPRIACTEIWSATTPRLRTWGARRH
jgi:hypothetical protein